MHPVRARTPQASWLVENGPRELDLLFHVIVYHRATPILVADNDGHCRQASAGASKLLGLPKDYRAKDGRLRGTELQASNPGPLAGLSGDWRAGRQGPANASGW